MGKKPSKNGQPLPSASDGRAPNGQFAEGNAYGAGNPYAKKVNLLRSALLDAVTTDDLIAVVAKLIERAKAGDIHAARELLDRCLGRPAASLELTTPDAPQVRPGLVAHILAAAGGDALLSELVERVDQLTAQQTGDPPA